MSAPPPSSPPAAAAAPPYADRTCPDSLLALSYQGSRHKVGKIGWAPCQITSTVEDNRKTPATLKGGRTSMGPLFFF